MILACLGWRPASADQDSPQLDVLFERLHATEDPREAKVIEALIWQVWLSADLPYINDLMRQAVGAMSRGDHEQALSTFSEIIALDPDYAEGWNKRATLHYLMGNYEASVADIQETLRLEPRHFGALSGLGLIYRALEDDEAAQRAFEAALEQNPHLSNARKFIEEIEQDRKNRDI